MSKKVKTGIIGCGKIARVSHAPGLRDAGAELVAFLDPAAERAQALADEFAPAATVCTTLEDLLALELDAVAVCTPNHLHCPQTLAALDAGLHVLCEKPIAGTLADGKRMITKARETGKILHINQSLRYHGSYQTLAKLAGDGTIGDVQHVRCIRASGNSPDKGWSPGAEWFVSKAAQGGLLLDIGIHMLDVMAWVGGPVAQVSGILQTRTPEIDVPDNVRALISYANGATGVLELSWTIPCGAGMLEVYGTKGTLRMGFGDDPIQLITPDDGVTVPEIPESPVDSFTAFLEAVRTGMPSATCGELGLRALAMCVAIEEAHDKGRFVTIRPID